MSLPRIVVTGMGAVSPLGAGVAANWARLIEGQSGIRPLEAAVGEGLLVAGVGNVPLLYADPQAGFDPDGAVSAKDQKKMAPFIVFALAAAAEALEQAQWAPTNELSQSRTATIIGSGVGGFGAIAQAVRITDERGPKRLSPFTIPSFLVNLAAGHVSNCIAVACFKISSTF